MQRIKFGTAAIALLNVFALTMGLALAAPVSADERSEREAIAKNARDQARQEAQEPQTSDRREPAPSKAREPQPRDIQERSGNQPQPQPSRGNHGQ